LQQSYNAKFYYYSTTAALHKVRFKNTNTAGCNYQTSAKTA